MKTKKKICKQWDAHATVPIFSSNTLKLCIWTHTRSYVVYARVGRKYARKALENHQPNCPKTSIFSTRPFPIGGQHTQHTKWPSMWVCCLCIQWKLLSIDRQWQSMVMTRRTAKYWIFIIKLSLKSIFVYM